MSALHTLGVKMGLTHDQPLPVVEQMKQGQQRMESVLDADMKEVLHKMEGRAPKPIESLTPADARRQPNLASGVVAQMAKEGKKPETVLHSEDIDIGDGVTVRVLLPVDPAHPDAKYDAKHVPSQLYSLIVYAHGGGWVICTNNDYETAARTLANSTRSVVIMVEYRKAPEHPFPAAHLDMLRAYEWATRNAARFHADPARVSLVGESAGGNLAVSTAVQTIVQAQSGFVRPRSVVAVYPVSQMTDFNSPSYHLNAHVKPLNRAMMLWFGQHYLRSSALSEQQIAGSYISNSKVAQAEQALADADKRTKEEAMPKKAHASAEVQQAMAMPASADVQAVPVMSSAQDLHVDLLRVPTEVLRQLPPVLILNAEVDPLLDDGLRLAEALRAAGVTVEQHTYSGVTHEFFGAGAVVAKAKQANERATAWINQCNASTHMTGDTHTAASRTGTHAHAAAVPASVVSTTHVPVTHVHAAALPAAVVPTTTHAPTAITHVSSAVSANAPMAALTQATSAVHFEETSRAATTSADATHGL